MPGYASWKDLYFEELRQLRDEGFDVSKAPAVKNDGTSVSVMPFPGWEHKAGGDDEMWEAAYHELWKLYGGKMRADYPYKEPNDFDAIIALADPAPVIDPVSGDEYEKRICGAVNGRIAGVLLGKPLETGMNDNDVRDYLKGADAWPLNDYVPEFSAGSGKSARWDCIPSTREHISYAQTDDDINYMLLAMSLTEKHGLDFSPADVGWNWVDNLPYHWLWCASRQAYYSLISGVDPDSVALNLNPWRESLDGQIRCDFWGYISGGDIYKAARLAQRDCSLNLIKNGIYGGMFVAGAIAAALDKKPTVEKIIAGGMAVIPHDSRLAETVRRVCKWYSEDGDFEVTCRRIFEIYGGMKFAGTENNMAMVVLALLHGGLDYTKTITTAVMCGIDTDCNGGTAGSIVGAAVGIDGIESRWYKAFNNTVKSCVACIGQISVDEIVERTMKVCRDTGALTD